MVFAIPALLALAFHPSLPKVHVSTVQATEPVEKNVGQAVNGSWNSFKQVVSERAAVQLDEGFPNRTRRLVSPGGTATEWSFDANGFVRPGSLALYSPSLSLADYEAQFLAIIDQKALSWVVRAEDFSNYYVIKLVVVVKPGPLTTLGFDPLRGDQWKAAESGGCRSAVHGSPRHDLPCATWTYMTIATYWRFQGQIVDALV